jgi:hypothetical protein
VPETDIPSLLTNEGMIDGIGFPTYTFNGSVFQFEVIPETDGVPEFLLV